MTLRIGSAWWPTREFSKRTQKSGLRIDAVIPVRTSFVWSHIEFTHLAIADLSGLVAFPVDVRSRP